MSDESAGLDMELKILSKTALSAATL